MRRRPTFSRNLAWASCLAVLVLAGCKTTAQRKLTDVLSPAEITKMSAPSNLRTWAPSLAVMPTAERNGAWLLVHNIRNCQYLNDRDCVVRHYDKTFDLGKLQGVDFIIVPFKDTPSLAHTMLSFAFGDEGHLAISIEARLEDGETYSPLKGMLRQYELMYVVADERDVIGLRAKHRRDDVYLFHSRATPQQAQVLLLDMLSRANKLAGQPEFYDTFANNCTTNLVDHVNRLSPGRVPTSIGTLLPGYADRLAYDLGLLDTQLPFEKAKRKADITRLANRNLDNPDYSRKIRQL
jgi:hypothetical protein